MDKWLSHQQLQPGPLNICRNETKRCMGLKMCHIAACWHSCESIALILNDGDATALMSYAKTEKVESGWLQQLRPIRAPSPAPRPCSWTAS